MHNWLYDCLFPHKTHATRTYRQGASNALPTTYVFMENSQRIVQFHLVHILSVHLCQLSVVSFEPRHEETRFCICEHKGTDQLCSNCAADQRIRFRYIDSTLPLHVLPKNPKFLASSHFLLSSSLVCVGPGRKP